MRSGINREASRRATTPTSRHDPADRIDGRAARRRRRFRRVRVLRSGNAPFEELPTRCPRRGRIPVLRRPGGERRRRWRGRTSTDRDVRRQRSLSGRTPADPHRRRQAGRRRTRHRLRPWRTADPKGRRCRRVRSVAVGAPGKRSVPRRRARREVRRAGQASARNARRRRRITLAAGGVLVAVMIAVAYPTFRSGVRIDLSSQELQSAAAPARPDAPRTPPAVDQTPAQATASAQTATAPAAEPAATPRAAPPVHQRRARRIAPISRRSSRAGATRNEQGVAHAAAGSPRALRTAAAAHRGTCSRHGGRPERAGSCRSRRSAADRRRGGRPTDETRTDNSSITCTERILALGLCGPEPSSRKE